MGSKGIDAERERKERLEKLGFFVSRSPGSLDCWDIFAVKNGQTRLEQVKKTREKTFYFSKESKEQLAALKLIQAKYGIECYFAIKFVRRGWLCIRVDDLTAEPIKF